MSTYINLKDFKNILIDKGLKDDIVIKFAVEELRKYFNLILRRRLSVLEWRESGKSIILNKEINISEKNSDAFSIKVDEKGNIIIGGTNSRSILSGCYEFLERLLDIKWYKPDEEILPKIPNELAQKDALNIKNKALLKYRGFYLDSQSFSINKDNIVRLIDWMGKKKASYILVSVVLFDKIKTLLIPEIKKRGIILEVGHHGFNFYLDPNKYFDKHPDWFSLVNNERYRGEFAFNMINDSQICVSNKGAVKAYTQNFLKFMGDNPEIDIFGVIPNDGFGWCQCAQCKKIEGKMEYSPYRDTNVSTGHPDCFIASGRYHYLVSKVASKVKKEYPDKKVSFWAYAGVIITSKYVDNFEDNTVLGFAPYKRCYQHNISDPDCNSRFEHMNSLYMNHLSDWRKKFHGDIMVYEYYSKYAWYSLPKIIPSMIRNEIKFYNKFPIQGISTMVEFENWFPYEINFNSFFDGMWEKELSEDKWLDIYIKTRFGNLEKQIKKIYVDIIDLMKFYGRLGSYYPPEEIQHTIKSLDNMTEELKILYNKTKTDSPEGINVKKLLDLIRYTRISFDLAEEINVLYLNCSSLSCEEVNKILNNILAKNEKLGEFVERENDTGLFIHEWLKHKEEKIREIVSEIRTLEKEESADIKSKVKGLRDTFGI
ncbi:MAG: DUF4838 domain-containing protein [bacterium]